MSHSRRRALVTVLLLGLVVAGIVVLFRAFDGDDSGYDYVADWSRPVVAGSTITLTYSGGACDDHAEARVDESAERVSITVLVTERHENACNAAGYLRTIDVTLTEPLGDRRLVDGADSAVRVGGRG